MGARKVPDLEKKDREWLKELRNRIWGIGYHEVKRPLTQGEFNKLVGIIRRHRLPVVVESDGGGFAFQFQIYNHPPVAGGIRPERIFVFHADHVPTAVILKCPRRDGNTHWVRDRVFFFMKKIFGTPWNLKLLKFYGLPLPQPREHYTY